MQNPESAASGLTPREFARTFRPRRPALAPGTIYMLVLSGLVLGAVIVAGIAAAAPQLSAVLTRPPALSFLVERLTGFLASPAGAPEVLAGSTAQPVVVSLVIAVLGLAVLLWALARFGPAGLSSAHLVWLYQLPDFSPAWFRSRILAAGLGGISGGAVIGLLALLPYVGWRLTLGADHAVLTSGLSGLGAWGVVAGCAALGGLGAFGLMILQARAAGSGLSLTEATGALLRVAAGAALLLAAAALAVPRLTGAVLGAGESVLVHLSGPVGLGAAAVLVLGACGLGAALLVSPPSFAWGQLASGARTSALVRSGIVAIDANLIAATVFSSLRRRVRSLRLTWVPAWAALPAGMLIGLVRTSGVMPLIVLTVTAPWLFATTAVGVLPVLATAFACCCLIVVSWLSCSSIRASAANPFLLDAYPYPAALCRMLLALAPAVLVVPAAVVIFTPAAILSGSAWLLAYACAFGALCAAASTAAALRPPPNWSAPAIMTDAGALPIGVLDQVAAPTFIVIGAGLATTIAAAEFLAPRTVAIILAVLFVWAVRRLLRRSEA